MTDKTKKVLTLMKTVRVEKNMSYQDIVDMCAANGEHVSLSTVKRVFGHGSEDMGFRYETTLQPIVRVVLGLDEDSSGVESDTNEPESATEIDALKSLVDLKNQMVSNLNQTIAEKNQQIEMIRANNKEQISSKDRSIEYLKEMVAEQKTSIRWYRRIVFALVCIAFALLLLVTIALVIDRLNPNIGFFWLE